LKVGFFFSDELVRKVNDFSASQEQMDDDTQLFTSDDGDRKLVFKQDLKVEFSNNTTQVMTSLDFLCKVVEYRKYRAFL